MTQEPPERDDRRRATKRQTGTLRGFLARIARNTEPQPRKSARDDDGHREVRGD